jgi:integrase
MNEPKKLPTGIFRPTWTRGGQLFKSDVLWIKYGCRHRCGKANCSGLHRESSESTSLKAARDLRTRRLAEVAKGRLIGPTAELTTFDDLAAMLTTDYQVNARKSLKRAKISIDRLREFFGPCRALAITTDRLNEYIAERQASKAANATIRNELAALRRMFTLAIQAGKMAQAPYIPSPRVINTRSGFFEVDQFRSVLKHLAVDLRPVVEFAYLTGWRIGEILGLEWRNVDFRVGEVRLDPGVTKNGEARTFPFSAYPPLGELLKWQRERTVAIEKKTKRIVSHVFHRNGRAILDFRGAWQKACAAAGVKGRLVHDFRRTAVRNLERASVPRSVAMKLTGHLTESIYRRYAIVSPADLKAGVEKLAKLYVEQSESAPAKVVVVLADRNART